MPLPKFLQWFIDLFKGPAALPAPAPIPPISPAPPAPAPLTLAQRVAAGQGPLTFENANDKRLFRNCFHEAAHALVAREYGETVERIHVDNNPFALFTKHTSDRLEDLIRRGHSGSPKILEALLRWVAIAVAGELQDTEADHERTRTSTRLDWSNYCPRSRVDIDRIVVMMTRAGFDYQTAHVQQAENRVTSIIGNKRAQYEALVTRLLDDGNITQPELATYLP